MTPFDPAAFDLAAYLARIGWTQAVAPDLPTLQAIARHHPLAIPFESLDPLCRRPVALDTGSLQAKLVHGGRGGWCFEHNLLLGTALAAIGFTVSGLSARVLWGVAPGVVRSRSHMVLLLDIGGDPFIADAGFGGLTMTGPLRLEADVEQETPHERMRLIASGGGYRLEARIRGEWSPLYSFDLQRQVRADYEAVNWLLCHHPQSHFLSTLVAARAMPDRRYALRNAELATHRQDGTTERRTLATAAELRQALEQLFGIAVPTDTDVETALARIAAGAEATPAVL